MTLILLRTGYGMDWVASKDAADPHADPRGVGLATIKVAPLANHSDPNITGCRGITNCTLVKQASKIKGNSRSFSEAHCTQHYVL